ncbi:uncharacterized protein [Littorina saxatilis]|uniref:Uncharacterized protein n=1 Tax=Littorina saxatilis TaxID=31220 RepID=A0AAN9B1U1_9CAEN
MAGAKVMLIFALGVALMSRASSQEKFFLFDVRGGDITASDVQNVMNSFDVEYIFQVTASDRYLVVLPKVLQTDLANVTFGPGTVTSLVVERSDDFYAKFGAAQSDALPDDLHCDDMMLVEAELLFTDLTTVQYKEMMKKMGNHLQTVHREYPVHGFHVIGHFPAKILSFDCEAEGVVDGFLTLVDNPFQLRIVASPILRIQ